MKKLEDYERIKFTCPNCNKATSGYIFKGGYIRPDCVGSCGDLFLSEIDIYTREIKNENPAP